LAKRYFTSHGPATLQDFAWWSGLPSADVTAAIEMSKTELAREVIKGKTYWLSPSARSTKRSRPAAWLLPPFDEYTVAYKDRRAILSRLSTKVSGDFGMGVLGPMVIVDGQVIGTWKRTLNKSSVEVSSSLFTQLNNSERQALAASAKRFGAFLEQPAELVIEKARESRLKPNFHI